MKNLTLAASLLALTAFTPPLMPVANPTAPAQDNDPNTTAEVPQDNKLIIYQLLPRLFGNKVALNKTYGTVLENGSGKFNDINDLALTKIKEMGVSHVWYTGILEHATMTAYPAAGLPADDADVVKGRAGSPYAVKDYYDVDPDLAVNKAKRMDEFESLIQRTHAHGLKLIIDFIPNHVARSYHSNAKPDGVVDLGEKDDKTKSFAPNNNFYYLPGEHFVVPAGYNPLGALKGPGEDGKYAEFPAKATGNDVFTATPKIDDWFETVKLNYGVDYQHNRALHFEPVPDTWKKMRDILVYWTEKGVDGFRCDMAEMVPVEFWAYVIPELKKVKPTLVFIGEAYNAKEYSTYLTKGHFDFLYDKVGLYDGLRRLMRQEGTTEDITQAWKTESRGFGSHMLRFLENHDEQRIASKEFATNPRRAIPAMTVSATLGSGPVMLYMGQEVGEPALGSEGFSSADGRTSIFDYWGVPEHQKWMNQGKFDGAKLSPEQKQLRDFYVRLLTLAGSSEAIRRGQFYELQDANNLGKEYDQRKLYTFVRYTRGQQVLVVVNFSDTKTYRPNLLIPAAVLQRMGLDPQHVYTYKDLLNGGAPKAALNLTLEPLSAMVLELSPR
ncbi:alpha-amylase family glycosyl hydrolase [Hymenobacter sp. H14-R3]|uniref:alpha-amylase family glycosyl hydrolase n=1 Tax=Hymenobacter sp. H14-R3 TaxID=3046308 RepID=UPI0024BA8334|nr:alpha-amylase family glycosyl hydrolase [Hymenobacter sp. H14-R3]MDJ0363811.1 alpha-amylase family glycosyl hydrolase [Hymenobacter sp. H14-R3]